MASITFPSAAKSSSSILTSQLFDVVAAIIIIIIIIILLFNAILWIVVTLYFDQFQFDLWVSRQF